MKRMLGVVVLTFCSGSAAAVAQEAPLPEDLAGRIAALGSAREAGRVEAARLLGELGPDASAATEPLLNAALGDESSGVREAAAEALEKVVVDPDAVVTTVARALLSGAEPARRAAVAVCVALANKPWAWELGSALTDALPDTTAEVRSRAALALALMARNWSDDGAPGLVEAPSWHPSAALPALLQLQRDPDAEVRRIGGLALHAVCGCVQVGEVEPILLPALEDDDPRVRLVAATGLGRNPEALRTLGSLLEGGDEEIRKGAARTLANLQYVDDAATVLLVGGLDDESKSVRILCGAGLGSRGQTSALARDALLTAVEDAQASVREAAAAGLGRLLHRDSDDPQVVKALARLLADDPVPAVRIAAAGAFLQTPEGSQALQAAAEEDPEEAVRAAAKRTLKELSRR